MELVLTAQDLEPLPKQKVETINLENVGLLTSNYKSISRNNYSNFNPQSVFGIKQLVKARKYRFTPNIETVLKVSLFAIVMIITLS